MARRGYAERPVMPHAVGSVGVVAVQNGFVRTIDWRGAHIEAIDQIRLPGELVMPERVNGTWSSDRSINTHAVATVCSPSG